MSNCIMLVGKIKEIKNDGIDLEVNSLYKNQDGEYEKSIIPIKIFENLIGKIHEYCDVGSIAGIRGFVKTENENIIIIADKVTFLSSKKDNE